MWNEAIPVKHDKVVFLGRYEQNEDGYWSGENPFTPEDHRPRDGQAVVYVLFDHMNVPCYVGSTEKFKGRIKSHLRDKTFVRWVAYPCSDRAAAYEMEDRLLKQHKPYLNKRAGR